MPTLRDPLTGLTIVNPPTSDRIPYDYEGELAATLGQVPIPRLGEIATSNQTEQAALAKGGLYPSYGREVPRTFTGCDISVHIMANGTVKKFAEVQTLSYSTHREKMPVRLLGRTNPVGHTRGPRTIAGSMIFTVFDRNALWEVTRSWSRYGDNSPAGSYPLADQLPPFDLTITFQNEYGDMAAIRILGVEIVDEGQVQSIDDLILENNVQYIARDMVPFAPAGSETPDFNRLNAFIPNYGLFLSNSVPESFVAQVDQVKREISATERLLAIYANIINGVEFNRPAAFQEMTVEQAHTGFNKLSTQLEALYNKLGAITTGVLETDRSSVNDPNSDGYSTPWENLDFRLR